MAGVTKQQFKALTRPFNHARLRLLCQYNRIYLKYYENNNKAFPFIQGAIMKTLLLLALAGALGTLARFGLSGFINGIMGSMGSAFPWGIFVTNVLGCFLFGAVWSMAGIHQILSDSTRIILLTGFMGSFTTFSTFIFDSQSLLENSNWTALSLNICGQILLGMLALQCGIKGVSAIVSYIR